MTRTHYENMSKEEMKRIKEETIQEKNIIKTKDNCYRFINNKEMLLSHGFGRKESLIKYKNDLRFDTNTLLLMSDRYNIFQMDIIKEESNIVKFNLTWNTQNGYNANINNIYLWQTAIKYTVAKLENGYYKEHRYFDNLEDALNELKSKSI